MKDLIKILAQNIVDNPDGVMVSEIEGENTSILELRVMKEDLGKVIGKHGQTAQAMRTLIGAATGKNKRRVVLEIIDYKLIG